MAAFYDKWSKKLILKANKDKQRNGKKAERFHELIQISYKGQKK